MNVVCLNCARVVETEDKRKKFCGKVCRNRWNVRKSSQKPKEEKTAISDLRNLINGAGAQILKNVVRVSAQAQTYQKDEWVDPI